MEAQPHDHTNVCVTTTPRPEIQLISGLSLCVETLADGRWVGRERVANGHVPFPNTPPGGPAFGIARGEHWLRDEWEFVAAEEVESGRAGSRHAVVRLTNPTHGLSVSVHTLLDGTPVMVRWLEITNTGHDPFPVSGVDVWSGYLWREDGLLGMQPFTLGHFACPEWGSEGWLEWNPVPQPKPIPDGKTTIRSTRGQGHDAPFFIARNETKGEYFIGHLAWSANWVMEFERHVWPTGVSTALLFRIGPWASSALRVIAPGEAITTPAVHLGHVAGSLDETVQAMHEHLRRSVIPQPRPERAHRIQLLVPADQGYHGDEHFTEENARHCVDVAAELGAEVFTLDAYWWDITGDWYPSPERFPHGLDPLREYIHGKGMLFGLYIEAEGGRGPMERSRVGREHPEWLGPKGVVNLTIPEAAQWMESEICRVLDQYRPDLYRLDYNPQFTYEGPHTVREGIEENNAWRYYEAFSEIYERLRTKYPDVIFQQCAAGGARNDLGTARHFHETYLTDGLWMPHVLRVYAGQTLALPPESLVVAIGAPGWKGPLRTYLRSTFALSTPLIAFGPAPDVATINPQVRAELRRLADVYREFIRPLLPTCRMFHHAPVNARSGVGEGGWFAVEFAASDYRKGWALVVRIGETDSDTYTLVPRGLDAGLDYRVTLDEAGSTFQMSGLSLTREGLPIRLEARAASELVLFEAV